MVVPHLKQTHDYNKSNTLEINLYTNPGPHPPQKHPERNLPPCSHHQNCLKPLLPRSTHIVGTLFKEIMKDKMLPDARTFAGMFSSVSVLMDVMFGRQVYCVGVKVGRCQDVFVRSSLLNVYCKCGEMWDARKVFDELPKRNSFTLAMSISGYAMRRVCGEAIRLFKEVARDEGMRGVFISLS
nr:hypothetical protein [Tanacetum cinerariifolium]